MRTFQGCWIINSVIGKVFAFLALTVPRYYRSKLAQCVPPAIPHIGIFLNELVYISEKFSDVVDSNLINFSKCVKIHTTIAYARLLIGILTSSQISRYQREGYNFRPLLPIKEQLVAKETITGREDAVIDISFSLEPKTS